jgi:predicted nucleotidyltransferase
MAQAVSSELAEALGSDAVARLVLHYAVHPHPPLHGRALERHTGLASQSLHTALERLTGWGVLRPEQQGRKIVYHLREDHPRWSALREMVRSFADPAEVLSEAFAEVEGIEAAFVFGSIARGDPHPDSDVDLFVLGENISTLELGRAIQDAQLLLNRGIDTKRFTPRQLARRVKRSGGFVHEALNGPKKWVAGSARTLEGIGVG